MEWGFLIRLPKNTYKYILLYPAHMFLTVGMTLGIRVPVVGPLRYQLPKTQWGPFGGAGIYYGYMIDIYLQCVKSSTHDQSIHASLFVAKHRESSPVLLDRIASGESECLVRNGSLACSRASPGLKPWHSKKTLQQ